MGRDPVLDWLLDGDVSVQFQTARDLLHRDDDGLRRRIATEGDGATILAARHRDGHWGRGFYRPKWTSSHYTLLELRNLGLDPSQPAARDTVTRILREEKGRDGGLDPSATIRRSDACVNGMALNYATYFGAAEEDLASIVDFLLAGRIVDGGFNCRVNRGDAVRHSSMHSTLSVIEGVTDYERAGYRYRLEELLDARYSGVEFLLRHRLFRSERTGTVIRPEFVRLHHPTRWYYDILRCLDSFADAGVPYDDRMAEALDVLRSRRTPDGRWPVNHAYPGETHLPNPLPGTPHRWVTLGALRVLQAYASGSADPSADPSGGRRRTV